MIAKVTFNPAGKTAEIDPAKPVEGLGVPNSLLNVAEKAGVEIEHPCDGAGTCGLCAVVIEQGADHLVEQSPEERDVLEQCGCEAGSRLACQAAVTGDVVCRVP